jgi:hypothetical protein
MGSAEKGEGGKKDEQQEKCGSITFSEKDKVRKGGRDAVCGRTVTGSESGHFALAFSCRTLFPSTRKRVQQKDGVRQRLR